MATSRVLGVRYRLGEDDWREWLRRLAEMRYRGAIVGPHGSGKTTLLEDLAPRLEGLGFAVRWLRLSEDKARLDRDARGWLGGGVGGGEVVLLDGAEQLGWLAWRRFCHWTSEAGGVVITAHRRGRMPVWHECRTSPDLLADIMAQLLGGGREAYRGDAERLFGLYRGNVRLALRHLYDQFAESHR